MRFFWVPALTFLNCGVYLHHDYAKVAQLVERDLAKVEVAGSNPVFRSPQKAPATVLFGLRATANHS